MKPRRSDNLEDVERMARVAYGDRPPVTDVSADVLRRIRTEKTLINERPLVIFAMGSLVMAMAVLAISVPAMMSMLDPLNTLFETTPLALL
jgi:hypothetical protein